ncbi:MAG: tetratricopeptide repeat protein [Acidobacteria bacterium]|nr:tetratricopeptide repeat protein [Acidobacteriota bacterium]
MKLKLFARCAVACVLASTGLLRAQVPAFAPSKTPDRASAYYHFAMAHLYEQLAREYRSLDRLNKAIEEYKLAIQADPTSDFLSSELVDLYAEAGRLQDAVAEAESVLQRDPKNVQMRRVLGRIYRGYLAEPGQGRLNEDLLRRAIAQYEKIIELDPKDVESHLHLANLYRVNRDSVKAEQMLKKALELDPSSDEALTTLASLYSEIGDNAGAIEMLSRVSKKNPSSKVLAALGAAYSQSNQPEKAVEALEKAVQIDPSNIDARRLLAQSLLGADQYDKALIQYQTLVQNDPQDPRNYVSLSQIYRHRRAFEQARENLEKAKALAPADWIEVPYNEVILLETEGKTDQAIAVLEKLIQSTAKAGSADYTARERSNRAFFYEKLGMLERSQENFAAAEKSFRSMVETDPESAPRSSVQLVDLFRAAREFDRALSESEAAFKKYPKDRTVLLVRASLLGDAGKADKGAELIRSQLKNDPSDRDLLLTLAQVYEKGKMYAEAAAAIEKAKTYAQTKEQKRAVYFTFGSLLERQKLYDEAEKQFRLVLDIDPDSAETLNYLGYMLADRNVRLDEAHDLIKKALELDPDNGAYLDSLGWVYYRQNKLDRAEDMLRRALEKTSRDPTVHDHLGDVFFKQGKIRQALDEWQRSLREWEASSKAEINPEEIAKIRKKLDDVKVRLAKEQAGVRQPQ